MADDTTANTFPTTELRVSRTRAASMARARVLKGAHLSDAVAAGGTQRIGPALEQGLQQIGDSFDEIVLPHLNAAHRLARWLMRNEHDAEDVVQDASLRAFRYFRTFAGGDGRAWFLRIVRNTCSGWRGRRFEALADSFDEEQHRSARPAFDPEALLLQTDDATLIARAMRHLPDGFHQLLVLRELEGLSYRELADAMGIPIGTVMSRLSRARDALRGALVSELRPQACRRTLTFDSRTQRRTEASLDFEG